MKKILLFTVCAMLFATSCDNGNWFEGLGNKYEDNTSYDDNHDSQEDEREYHFWDRQRLHIPFAIFDAGENNILEIDPEALYDVEIIYEGNSYVYEGTTTRAAELEELMIYTRTSAPYTFTFGELDWDMSGSCIIYFRGNEWKIDFSSQRNIEVGLDVSIIIDEVVAERVAIGTFIFESKELEYTAYPLYIK